MKLAALIGAALAILCLAAPPALALGPNSITGVINASSTAPTVGAGVLCSGLTTTQTGCTAVPFLVDNGQPGATIFTGSLAQTQSLSIQIGPWAGTGTVIVQSSQDEGATWQTDTNTYLAPVGPGGVSQQVTSVACTTGSCSATNLVVNVAAKTTYRVIGTAWTAGYVPIFITGFVGSPVFTGVLSNSPRPSYTSTLSVPVPTASSTLVALEADASNKLRLRYLKICLDSTAKQTAATNRTFALFRTTATSTAGGTTTSTPMDPADAAFAGVLRSASTAMTSTPSGNALTIAASSLWSPTIFMPAVTSSTVPCAERSFDLGGIKPPTVAAGVNNGFGLADLTGGAGAAGNYVIDLEWTVEPN